MSGALRAGDAAELRAEVAKLKAENVAMGDTVQRRAAEIMHLTVRGEDQRAEADALRERCAKLEAALQGVLGILGAPMPAPFEIRLSPQVAAAREALTPPAT